MVQRATGATDDAATTLSKASPNGVWAEFAKECLGSTGGDSPRAKLTLSVMGLRQFERSLIRECQREGIALA